jgi:tetratricopeptide (TPR) repeat protein
MDAPRARVDAATRDARVDLSGGVGPAVSAVGSASKPGTGELVRTFSAIIAAVFALTTGAVQPAFAEDVEDAIAASMRDADAGRCDEALRRIVDIEGLEDRALLLAGECRIRAGLYPEALADLDRIDEGADLSAGQRGDADLYRAVALYHLDRFTEAEVALDAADGKTREEAQFALYRGLLDLRNGDNERAAPLLETAARLSPATTEPVASYYAGMAWHGASERSKARAAFMRVIEQDGNGPWGKEAAKMLESTELFPYYVRMSAGIEYDDNVILQGGETQFVQQGSGLQITEDGEKDWRGVWRLETGMQLFNVDDWSGGVTGSYTGNAHYDLDEFNTNYPTIGAYLARRLGPNTAAQVRYQFGFAWLKDNSFLRTHSTEAGISHTWDKAGRTIVVADLVANDLRFTPDDITDEGAGGTCASTTSGCGPVGLREDQQREQDGIGVGAAVHHEIPISVPSAIDEVVEEIDLVGGYRFRYYDAEGDEWEHFAHILSAGIIVELPFEVSIATRATYEYRDFANPSTFPDNEVVGVSYVPLSNVDREEHEVTFEAEIEKDLNEYLSVSARWHYLDNESNRRVYDYSRHIVGGYVNFRFD